MAEIDLVAGLIERPIFGEGDALGLVVAFARSTRDTFVELRNFQSTPMHHEIGQRLREQSAALPNSVEDLLVRRDHIVEILQG